MSKEEKDKILRLICITDSMPKDAIGFPNISIIFAFAVRSPFALHSRSASAHRSKFTHSSPNTPFAVRVFSVRSLLAQLALTDQVGK